MGAGLCEGYQAVGGRSTSAPAALQPAPTRSAGRKKIIIFLAVHPGAPAPDELGGTDIPFHRLNLSGTSPVPTGIAPFSRVNLPRTSSGRTEIPVHPAELVWDQARFPPGSPRSPG